MRVILLFACCICFVATTSYAADTTTLYEIKQGVCGETINFPTKYVKLAEKFDKNLKVGTCESVGYTVFFQNVTKKTPIGTFTIEEFKKKSAYGDSDGNTTTLYEIKQGVCGETINFPTKYVKLAEKFDKNLKVGTCESVGYTVFFQNVTKKTPIGTFTIEEFKKKSASVEK
mgnify:CR=1 FL=1